MRFNCHSCLSGFSLILIISALPAAARSEESPIATWLQWRGPQRDSQVEGPAWPPALDVEHLQKVWSVPLGPSYSGPIVAADRVFVTETVDKETEVVRALDRQSGKELWKISWPGAINVPFFAKSNGDWIRSTPAFDGERLYVAGIRDVLVCLNGADGQEIWRVDFAQTTGAKLPAFGCVCSPLIDGDFVYIQAGAGLVKLDKYSGKIIWHGLRDGGGMYGSAFSSPVIRTINGQRQLLVQTRKKLAGVALDSGEELWSQEIPAFRGMNILTPTVIGNSVFTSSYGGGSYLYTLNNGAATAEQRWRNKVQGYMSSPVVIDGHIYLHLRNKRFACINIETGQEAWVTKPFGKYWSMVAQGDRILALDERGDLLLIRANPQQFELIDKRHISDEPTWAHLAVCGDQLFIRALNEQSMYRWK
ncbi:Outer membrane protein assembly factor BamB precursor [Symmachiella dynata]|uniref:Outer membrane protein assembly factor BamB n=1 Tax=Symmachiella dynata TaxID=2527995 RepID=A0A517ZK11_9PLAN|nr:PQQ-binding-like beta-propeller repeat protein [Symmachiella dynata]QDU42815.1 Outer membrane protein assembly factor BamB precursor [Symmachiella dynata]